MDIGCSRRFGPSAHIPSVHPFQPWVLSCYGWLLTGIQRLLSGVHPKMYFGMHRSSHLSISGHRSSKPTTWLQGLGLYGLNAHVARAARASERKDLHRF